ncbi:MAG: DNA polymerase III subunit alpha [Candidatus Zixiibacteriota bacterium]
MSYALPGCRSNFSLLWGTAPVEELITTGAKNNIEYLGLADNDNLYGAIDFYQDCLEAGINPLIGVRLTTRLGELHLIAKSHAGYQNLCRLVTARQLEGDVSEDTLAKQIDDLICLAPPKSNLKKLKDIFGIELFLSHPGDVDYHIDETLKRYDLKPVANPKISFLRPDDYSLHLMLRAIDTGSLVANLNGVPRDGADSFFPDASIMKRKFRNCPEAIANGIMISEMCRMRFPERSNILPEYNDGDGDKFEFLRKKTLEGLGHRKGKIRAQYLARLDFELEVIKRTGFTDYFLIVSGIADYCHRVGIPVVGRGSAGGSLAAYSLSITQVDPINEGLYFERFLNEARSDPPDIDLDIDWRRRDDVLEYIYDTFGHDRTAMIATYTRFRSRLAVREIAKARGIAPDEINRIVKDLPRFGMMGANSEIKIPSDEYLGIWEDAARLHEFPRHLGIHAGGIVITPKPLTDYVALERATKGLVVTQCDMYQAEKLGLVKIDILGNRGQAVIVDCFEEAKKERGDDFVIPDNDPKTERLLQSGKTIGVFQIESPGLRSLLRDIKPTVLNDLTLALSLIRPGASDSGMKKVFLDCHHGRQRPVYPDIRLKEILEETHGVFIYQEQVLLCAREIAGFNLPMADLLRRAMTKGRKGGKFKRLCNQFLDGAVKNGASRKKAIEIFKLLALFAGYGFCKAHAATYGYLGYQSAFLKAHYPARFMQAVLNNGGGYYAAAIYIAEARRLGVKIMPPDINMSERYEAVDRDVMYVGLGRIRDLGENTIEQILDKRPFASFDDFVESVRLSAGELENLIKIGTFDKIDTIRPCLLWRLRLRRGKRQPAGAAFSIKQTGDDDIFSGQLIVPRAGYLPELPDFTPFEKFLCEREILGLSASEHPLKLFPAYDGKSFFEVCENREANEKVSITAWLADVKRIKTREKKEWMVFLTFEDLHDTFEVVLFPESYKKYYEMARRFRYFYIEGKLNTDGGTTAIIAEKLSPAPTGLSEKTYL